MSRARCAQREGYGLAHGHGAYYHPHCGVYTNHHTAFSHMLPEVCKVSSQMSSNSVKIKIASTARLQGILWLLLPVFFFVVYIKWQRMHRQQFTLIINCTQKWRYYDVRLWVNMLLLVWIPHWTSIFELRHSTDSEWTITQRYAAITAHY